jgi:uncharacterized membrane protein
MRARGFIEELPALTSVAVLGLGFVVLGLGYSWFWVVWAAGFVSLVPIAAILSEHVFDAEPESPPPGESDETRALQSLRERYANGEIDEPEFERRLDDLLATESVVEARARVEESPDWTATEVEGDRT